MTRFSRFPQLSHRLGTSPRVRSATPVGGSLRWTNCTRICSELERPWNFLLCRDGAPGRGGGGIDFYHALGNHFGGKHAGSVSWAGVARRRLFPRRSANRDRRATRFLSVLALRRAHLPISASFGREWRRSDFRPDTALRRFRGLGLSFFLQSFFNL